MPEYSKQCSAKWRDLGDEEKEQFEDKATKDKERYKEAMTAYKASDGFKKYHKEKDVYDKQQKKLAKAKAKAKKKGKSKKKKRQQSTK